MKAFFAKLWSWIKTAARFAIAPIGVILIVLVGGFLVAAGLKNVQVGGLIATLLGKKKTGSKAVAVANSVPKDRVDANGKLIPVGTADSKGITQAAVVEIDRPSWLGDPKTVQFTPPGEQKPVTVDLPDGVHATDVEHVVVVKPGEFVVTVKDSSGISATKVDSLLSKYGGK